MDMLIITIGNRDLQVKPYFFSDYIKSEMLIRNNDSNEELWTINTRNRELSFLEISKIIFENKDSLISQDALIFPMIHLSLDEVLKKGNIKYKYEFKIVLTTSNQEPKDRQDCFFIAKIVRAYLETKGFEVDVRTFSCKPTDFKELTLFYTSLFNDIEKENPGAKITVSNSGGTPDMRSATYFAGILKNFHYISINAREQSVITQTFPQIKNQVLKVSLLKMLSAYDYQGIININLSNEINQEAERALSYYNLNVQLVFSPAPTKKPKPPYYEKSAEGLELLVDNMRVCYAQGRYAECLQRLFRIEEATWYLLFYEYLKEKKCLDTDNVNKVVYGFNGHTVRKDFEKDFINFGNHYLGDFLQTRYPNLVRKEAGGYLFFKSVNTGEFDVPLYSKNYFYHFFKFEKYKTNFCNFWGQLNQDEEGISYSKNSRLNQLRNRSFLGHGIEGVSKENLDKLLNQNNYDKFDRTLRNLFKQELNLDFKRIFDYLNQNILIHVPE